MSKNKPDKSRPGKSSKSADAKPSEGGASGEGAPAPRPDFARETVESVVIAFVLAFLFRTFVAEAFVIPTGSMATTLMGRHMDLECGKCQYRYQVSTSGEVDDQGRLQQGVDPVDSTLCPMCGYTMKVGDRNRVEDQKLDREYPSYKGDRIIVTKFSYALSEPKRWDVVVFKYPQGASTNFIKRLVGLPGEVLRIKGGDVYAKPLGADDSQFKILRKPPDKVLAMARAVYDNRFVVDELTKNGWPARWQPAPASLPDLLKKNWPKQLSVWPANQTASGGWKTEDGFRTFATDGRPEKEVWLRYQHHWPHLWDQILARGNQTGNVWGEIAAAADTSERPTFSWQRQPRPPEFVTDFAAYNISARDQPLPHVVNDLVLECELSIEKAEGEAVLELVKWGHFFRCRFDLSSGTATLSIDDGATPFDGKNSSDEETRGDGGKSLRTAKTDVKSPGSYRVRFANVDQQLLLWVEDEVASFSGPTTYALDIPYPEYDGIRLNEIPDADRSPVGIAAKGVEMKVSGLKLLRDVMYIPAPPPFQYPTDYPLQEDQFFVMGDNSPQSKDARMWTDVQYVDRKFLIGKALFIYWPHSWDTPVPFTPNFGRMGFVR